MQRTIKVCLTPALLKSYTFADDIVVVTDVLRATSSMAVILSKGASAIRPVAKVEDALYWKSKGYLVAGERNGQRLPGLDFGNSPFDFLEADITDKEIVMTTTNGTKAISASQDCALLLTAAFVNFSALVNVIRAREESVTVVCAGWKDNFNLEDCLFAGALVQELNDVCVEGCDSAMAMKEMYGAVKDNLREFMSKSSHFNRLERLNISKDIDYCFTWNQLDVVPCLKDGKLVNYQP
jgi:2-phosphosulfolactate phosphatase